MKTLIRYMVYSHHGDPLDASLYNDEAEAIKRAKEYQDAIVYAVSVKPYAVVYKTIDYNKGETK
jgi:hypothetical protein